MGSRALALESRAFALRSRALALESLGSRALALESRASALRSHALALESLALAPDLGTSEIRHLATTERLSDGTSREMGGALAPPLEHLVSTYVGIAGSDAISHSFGMLRIFGTFELHV